MASSDHQIVWKAPASAIPKSVNTRIESRADDCSVARLNNTSSTRMIVSYSATTCAKSWRSSRRRLLQVGGLGCGGLTWPMLLAAERNAVTATMPRSFGRAKRCVMLFLTGGIPQHDTFDPKPLAPVNVRGELSPIATSVPGVQVTELFPQFARRADRVMLLRSVTHDDTVHTSAGYTMLTGRRHPQANAKTAADIKPLPTDHPHIGSILSRVRPEAGPPTFVSLPEIIKDAGVNEFPGLRGGFLSERYSPLLIEGSPQTNRFTPPPLTLADGLSRERFVERQRLLASLDRRLTADSVSSRVAVADAQRERVFSLLASNAVQHAFDLNQESAATRRRYGSHLFGQGCLLARRLLEAKVALVTVYWHYEGPDDSPVWDTHWNNFDHLRNRLAPPTDIAMSALLDDLSDRGLLDDTLFLVMGEFGRSPQINAKAGRDHWPQVATTILAGAGINPGGTFGASDRLGAAPADHPVTPADLTATILHLLGVAPDFDLFDQAGRPHRACEGSPVTGLFA